MRLETDPTLDAVRLGLQISGQQAEEMACVHLCYFVMVFLTIGILAATLLWQSQLQPLQPPTRRSLPDRTSVEARNET